MKSKLSLYGEKCYSRECYSFGIDKAEYFLVKQTPVWAGFSSELFPGLLPSHQRPAGIQLTNLAARFFMGYCASDANEAILLGDLLSEYF